MNKICGKDKRAILSAIFFCFGFLILLPGCKKEDSDLGLQVQPEEDVLDGMVVDTFALQTYSHVEDSLRTSNLTSVMLGSYHHNAFGTFEAGFCTQVSISGASPTFDLPNLSVDSVVVQLVYGGFYGSKDVQQFEVYALTEELNKDSAYYSNHVVQYDPNNLAPPASNNFAPNTSDSVLVGSTLIRPHMRIHLSQTFGYDLLSSGAMTDNTTFRNYLKGLYFKTNTMLSPGTGGISYINLSDANSKIVVYYHDLTDTTEYNYLLTDSDARFTVTQTDHSGSAVQAQLSDSTLGNDYFYVQAGGSLVADIRIPSITNLTVNQNIIVNKAELVLPVQYYTFDLYSPPSRLLCFPYDEAGEYYVSLDQVTNDVYSGGYYDDTRKAYVFNLNRHIQQLMTGSKTNHGFRIATYAGAVVANGVVLNGPNSFNRAKPYLRIIYTKYQ